ncbi:hypothetical protein TBR22_A13170 [Luteitalea sp. TBR-22]|uniref:zf-HC2 domain-containing protein n=1 Tax=Luteitalea sp. TBR-22 TaxID=2802971 RepID=UPI001AF30534|nr:zf-HC2 domain-containing protein [Luteitalea sp. TBR-22]BCS32108.1 hypothetical protein TBR22_A13170 [Luteitalea sp. TBR-22]
MTSPGCTRLTFAALLDYASGDLSPDEGMALEDHLFSCGACGTRAAAAEALVRAIGAAVRTSQVGGFVTDAVLNRLAREGLRVRSYTLAPGAVVPCAVWDDDDLMVLRLRADVGEATEVTLTRRVAGGAAVQVTGPVSRETPGEILFMDPAAWIRELPVVRVDLELSAHVGETPRPVGRYTLVHAGALRR